jgi:diacylglycerol O-acyltransferase / wax synthase
VSYEESKVPQSPESCLSPSSVRLWAPFNQRRIMKTMFERVSADDLMSLASKRHPPPLQVGAALILEAPGELDVGGLRTVLQQRIAAVPRLRQRLQRVPLGCGRPIWVDDAGFTIDDHVTVVTPHSEADDAGLLDIAADLVTKPLPEDRPLWSATLVPGMTGGRAGLVLVMHHVVGDGLAGLAVLRGLVDGSAASAAAAVPQPRPTRAALAKDAWRGHIRSLQRLTKGLGRLFAAFDELRPSLAGRAQPCSLNKPTGPRRSIRTIVVDLHQVRELAHGNGATVNDLVLTAVTGALHQLLTDRGERLDTLVVSVPFAARTRTEPGQLGNRSGVIPVNLPTSGGFSDRLTAVSAIMRAAKQYERGASTAVLGPVFRLLARLGMYQYFIDHQPFVHTFVSDLRGPDEPLSVLGCRVLEVVPLSVATGNVTVSFTALSYDKRLVITMIFDPETCPDADRLSSALKSQFAGS